eukprot:7363496-Alexandrium_andersonii.AAC.1
MLTQASDTNTRCTSRQPIAAPKWPIGRVQARSTDHRRCLRRTGDCDIYPQRAPTSACAGPCWARGRAGRRTGGSSREPRQTSASAVWSSG